MRMPQKSIGWIVVGAAIAPSVIGIRAETATAADSNLCAPAKELGDLGATTEARRAYAALLLSHPGLECAVTGLTAITKPTPADPVAEAQVLCARGDVYRDRGLDADAKKAYDEALAKNVDASCASDGLKPSGWSRAADWVEHAAPTALLLAGGLLVVVLFALMLAYLPPVGWLYRRLGLNRSLLRPRLALADLDDACLGDDKVGAAMTGRIRERLQRFREEALADAAEGYPLDRGTSDQPLADIVAGDGQLKSALKGLGDASDHTKVVTAIIDFAITALPVTRLAVSGVLEPGREKVPAATLMLTEGPRLAATVALDAPASRVDLTSGDYMRLCDAAAVWVQYEVARQLRGGEIERDDAESYALVRVGLDFLATGEYDLAITAFDQAIAIQPTNWSAHVNLFATLTRHTRTPGVDGRIEAVMAKMEQAGATW
jgi:tetratricopeptide (TPR) repeat protein